MVEDENGKDEGYREEEEGSSDEDMVGPTLPGLEPKRRAGVAIPSKDDLELQREQMAEDEEFRRLDLRFERKLDRRTQKERLDELVPRAEPGTRERQLEKKRELNDKMRSFREKSPDAEVDEGTLMGDGGGLEMFKKQKAAMERKKNERELRREQILRARIAEREERLQAHREKEENTMRLLHVSLSAEFPKVSNLLTYCSNLRVASRTSGIIKLSIGMAKAQRLCHDYGNVFVAVSTV